MSQQPNNRFTPGPWSISSAYPLAIEREVPGLADGYDSYLIAEAKGHSLISQGEAEANARLIAASPDLLLAIQTLLDCGRAAVGANPQDDNAQEALDMFWEAQKQARAAVIKATGVRK